MNKYETAIAEIKDHAEHNLKIKLSVETAEMAIEALGKQIQFKPTKCMVTEGKCKCGVGFTDKETNYCGNCGQKLDWSHENE